LETHAQRKRKDTGNLKRKHYIALSGERVLKGAVDVSDGDCEERLPLKTFTGQKKLLGESAVQLLLNCCKKSII
jgi:hypothetical protein